MRDIVERVRGRAVFYTTGSRKTNPPDRLGRVTGRLASSISTRVIARSGVIIGEVFTQALVYARIHEFGGTIVPRRAPFLVFTGEDGGLVFTKKVKIPARPYIGRALDDKAGDIKAVLGEAFESSVK